MIPFSVLFWKVDSGNGTFMNMKNVAEKTKEGKIPQNFKSDNDWLSSNYCICLIQGKQ